MEAKIKAWAQAQARAWAWAGTGTNESANTDESTLHLSETYEAEISEGLASLSHENVVSFYNQRLNQETLRSLELEIETHQGLLESEDYYLCVNNYLPGFPDQPLSKKRIELPRTTVPVVRMVDTEELRLKDKNNGSTNVFWKIAYYDSYNSYNSNPDSYGSADKEYKGYKGYKEYWAKKSIIKHNGETVHFITRYKDCPKIQDELMEIHIEIREEERQIKIKEEADATDVALPEQGSGFMEYICTQNPGLKAYDTPKDVEKNNKSKTAPDGIPRGMQVVRVQGEDSKPFKARRNGVRYIRVQVQINSEEKSTDEMENQRYWVGENFIKQFEDCASVQTEVFHVCSEDPVNYYLNSLNLSREQPSGAVGSFELLYRRYGEVFSKRVLLNFENKEVIYVPVSKGRNSKEILWIEEKKLPRNCPLNLAVPREFTTRDGRRSCTVISNDNFPLEHPSRIDYRTDSAAMFGAKRNRGRKHPATDLYSFYRYGPNSTKRFGGNVRAINESVVKRIGNWKHTKYLIVQSEVAQRSWVYGEVRNLKVRDEQVLNRDQLIGVTAQFVRGRGRGAYPAMLHLERWENTHLSGRRFYGASGRIGNQRVDDPTCHVEYMSMKKFNKIWEGEDESLSKK